MTTYIFLFFFNEPVLGVGINPGIALTPLPSSIGQGSNPQPYDCEPSALLLDHSFVYIFCFFTISGRHQSNRKELSSSCANGLSGGHSSADARLLAEGESSSP